MFDINHRSRCKKVTDRFQWYTALFENEIYKDQCDSDTENSDIEFIYFQNEKKLNEYLRNELDKELSTYGLKENVQPEVMEQERTEPGQSFPFWR